MFKVLLSKKIAGNTVFNIFFDHLVDDKGNEVAEFLTVSPKFSTQNSLTGVGILPTLMQKNKETRWGLVQIYRHAIKETLWEIPRGFIDANETELEAAQRELFEETGLKFSINNITPSLTFSPEPGVISAKVKLFLAVISPEQVKVDKNSFISQEMGHKAFSWFTSEEILELINQSKIIDAGSLLALFRFAKINTNSI